MNTASNTSSGSQDQDGTGSSQPEPHRAGFRAYLSQNTPPERLPEASRSSGVTADQVPNSLLHVSLSDLGAGLREERLNSRPRQTEEPEACAAPITMDQAQSTQIVVSLPQTHCGRETAREIAEAVTSVLQQSPAPTVAFRD